MGEARTGDTPRRCGPLPHADLWHTGIIVDDLDAATRELSDQLGLTWFVGGASVRLMTDAGTTTVTTAYALSREGPHHIELGQSIPGTLWSVVAPGHAHHLGYWVDDVAAASAVLHDQGAPRAAAVTVADGVAPMCAYHRTASGLYVEVVSRAMKPMLLPTGDSHDDP